MSIPWRELLRLQQEELGLIPNIQGNLASFEFSKKKPSNQPDFINENQTEKKTRPLSKRSPLRNTLATTINAVDTLHFSSGHATSEPSSLDLTGVPLEASQRYHEARLKLLSQKVREGDETRKYLAEEAADLRRQLKMERDENAGLKNRYHYDNNHYIKYI